MRLGPAPKSQPLNWISASTASSERSRHDLGLLCKRFYIRRSTTRARSIRASSLRWIPTYSIVSRRCSRTSAVIRPRTSFRPSPDRSDFDDAGHRMVPTRPRRKVGTTATMGWIRITFATRRSSPSIKPDRTLLQQPAKGSYPEASLSVLNARHPCYSCFVNFRFLLKQW